MAESVRRIVIVTASEAIFRQKAAQLTGEGGVWFQCADGRIEAVLADGSDAEFVRIDWVGKPLQGATFDRI